MCLNMDVKIQLDSVNKLVWKIQIRGVTISQYSP